MPTVENLNICVKSFASCVPGKEGFQWAGSGFWREVVQTLPFRLFWSFWYWCSWDDDIAKAWFADDDIDEWDIDIGNIFRDNIDGGYIDQNDIAQDGIDDGDIDHKDIKRI